MLLKRPFQLILILLASLSLTMVGCGDEEATDDDTTDDVGVDTSDTGGDVEQDDSMPDVEDDTPDPDMDMSEDVEDVEKDEEDVPVDAPDMSDVTDTTDTVDMMDVEDDMPPACGFGSIQGRVCSPSGNDWLSNVEVSVTGVDCDGDPIVAQDFSDANGFYDLMNVPSGYHTITLNTGSYTATIENVLVEPNKVTDLTTALTKTCLDRRSAEIAVLTGVFDHMEVLLDNQGITYQLYEGDSADINPNPTRSGYDLLKNINELLTYDILFINSGEWYRVLRDPADPEVQLMRQNLQTFVNSGGSIMATDWAAYWIELAFPSAIEFFGDDADENDAKVGKLDPNVAATIESMEFQTALGTTSFNINFNWAAWVVAEGAGFQSVVHIRAPNAPIYPDPGVVSDAPIVVSFQPTPTSGTVFFSAFHAAVQPTSQMEDVLNFVIFQL